METISPFYQRGEDVTPSACRHSTPLATPVATRGDTTLSYTRQSRTQVSFENLSFSDIFRQTKNGVVPEPTLQFLHTYEDLLDASHVRRVMRTLGEAPRIEGDVSVLALVSDYVARAKYHHALDCAWHQSWIPSSFLAVLIEELSVHHALQVLVWYSSLAIWGGKLELGLKLLHQVRALTTVPPSSPSIAAGATDHRIATLPGCSRHHQSVTAEPAGHDQSIVTTSAPTLANSMFRLERRDALFVTRKITSILKFQGKVQDEESLLLQVYRTQQSTVGRSHPDCIETGLELASLYNSSGRQQEAAAMLMSALERVNWHTLCDEPTACEGMARWVKIISETSASVHKTAGTSTSEACSIQDMRNVVECLIDRLREAVGIDDASYLAALCHFAGLEHACGFPARAEQLLRQAYVTQRRVLGAEDYATLTTATSLAKLLALSPSDPVFEDVGGSTSSRHGRGEEAVSLLEFVLRIRCARYSSTHPLVQMARFDLARVYGTVGRQTDSQAELERLRASLLQTPGGADTVLFLTVSEQLAMLCMNLGRARDAEALLVQVRDVRSQTQGEGHPDYRRTLSLLERVYASSPVVAQMRGDLGTHEE